VAAVEQIILAFSKPETAQKFKKMLDGSGFKVRAVVHSVAELLRYLSNIDEVLVIMGYKLKDGQLDDVFEGLYPGQKLMSIVKAERQDMIDNEEIFVLPLPVGRERLISSIEVFLGHIERTKPKNVNRSAEDEEIIERAKLYLMEKYRMTEQQAHRFIQKRSMDTGAKFIDTARQILHI
jgi:AmiR/NasT family two-component response regulator